MESNTKNKDDDSENCAFVIGGAEFSIIYEINEAILYILGVEFT